MKKDINDNIDIMDSKIITWARTNSRTIARYALAVIFIWFGLLKILSLSSVTPLVMDLLNEIVPNLNASGVVLALGVYELVIGLMFLAKELVKLVLLFLLIHILFTALTLIFLPSVTWHSFLVPTLTGQYVLKNLIIVALGVGVLAHEKEFKK